MSDQPESLASLLPARLVGINDLNRDTIVQVMEAAKGYRSSSSASSTRRAGPGIVGTIFMQPSTRTLLSFQAAAYRLGHQVLSAGGGKLTRADDYYGESVRHLLVHMQEYADLIILRHYEVIGQDLVADLKVPLINAGDGYGEHPTQALGDVLTMLDVLGGSLAGKAVGILGSTSVRTVHSLIRAMALHGGVELFAYSNGIEILEDALPIQGCDSLGELLEKVDIVYVSGTDHPDFSKSYEPQSECERRPILRGADFSNSGAAPYIMHPGPRCHDLDAEAEANAKNIAQRQVVNCMYVRMALVNAYLRAPGDS